MSCQRSISVIGSGNWGSVIGKIVGNNVQNSSKYCQSVKMWVFEETVNDRKLTEIINTDHENVKYLPGTKLPPNLVANSDLIDCTTSADILIFVLPHQFLPKVLAQMKPHIKKGAYAASLIKGLDEGQSGIRLISDAIRETLGIDCAAIMGANLAPEVARENYCEVTVGAKDAAQGAELKGLFETHYFRVVCSQDEVGVELCGALKNVVAVGAGFAEALGYGDNTKAAIIRLGFMEMIRFITKFYGHRGVNQGTFLESCGVADLITTCYGGRNRKVAMEFVKTRKAIPQLEKELLNGQSAQGPLTAREVNAKLREVGEEQVYPLFTAVHHICQGTLDPMAFVEALKNHPEHM